MNKVNTIVASLFLVLVFSCGKTNVSSSGAGSSANSIADNRNSSSSSNASVPLEELFPSQYVKWVQNKDNGFLKEKTIGEMTFSVLRKPAEYIICQEERKDNIKEDVMKKKTAELEGMDYYDLKISLENGQGELLKYKVSSPAEYEQRVKYFAFDMQKDIVMVQGKDTVSCGMFHFERAYDVAPHAIFLLAFPKQNNKGEKTIVFNDRIFHKGILKFLFGEENLQRLPKLKTI